MVLYLTYIECLAAAWSCRPPSVNVQLVFSTDKVSLTHRFNVADESICDTLNWRLSKSWIYSVCDSYMPTLCRRSDWIWLNIWSTYVQTILVCEPNDWQRCSTQYSYSSYTWVPFIRTRTRTHTRCTCTQARTRMQDTRTRKLLVLVLILDVLVLMLVLVYRILVLVGYSYSYSYSMYLCSCSYSYAGYSCS